MDEVSVVIPGGSNLSNGDWFFPGGSDDEGGGGGLALDGSEGGLFSGNFVPPPPRPLFLDDGVSTDGLTTCDLCSWAWQNGNALYNDAIIEPTTELGWVLTLVIVSLVSALIGAIVMIIVLHCKKLKQLPNTDQERRLPPLRPPISTPDDKTPPPPYPPSAPPHLAGVWSWLSRRSAASPSQLRHSPAQFVENHYTHMEDAYNSVNGNGIGGDALYAELDDVERASNNTSPAYQNSAYTDPDAPSAPSSAYYSDLSVGGATSVAERAYEVVGLVTMPVWEPAEPGRKGAMRLEAIKESVTVPSDYV